MLGSDRRTTWKTRCAREGCNSAALPLSKYCSDFCGIEVAATRLEISGHHPELYWNAVKGARRREGVITPAGPRSSSPTNIDSHDRGLHALQESLSKLMTKRGSVEAHLSLVMSRLRFLGNTISRWERFCAAFAKASGATEFGGASSRPSKKSKKSKGGGPSGPTSLPDAPCGFDVRLVWDDADWHSWVESDEGRAMLTPNFSAMERSGSGEDEGGIELDENMICVVTRKRCDRHAGWQKTREADFEVERAILVRTRIVVHLQFTDRGDADRRGSSISWPPGRDNCGARSRT
jgi:COMPASS component SPP1